MNPKTNFTRTHLRSTALVLNIMESDINGMKNQMQLPIKDKFEIKNFNREITAM